MNNQVIELVSFKLRSGVKADDFLAASAVVDTWVKQQQGFIARRLCVADDGIWRDIVTWSNASQMQNAMKQFMPQVGDSEFIKMIDSDSLSMSHNVVRAQLNAQLVGTISVA